MPKFGFCFVESPLIVDTPARSGEGRVEFVVVKPEGVGGVGVEGLGMGGLGDEVEGLGEDGSGVVKFRVGGLGVDGVVVPSELGGTGGVKLRFVLVTVLFSVNPSVLPELFSVLVEELSLEINVLTGFELSLVVVG